MKKIICHDVMFAKSSGTDEVIDLYETVEEVVASDLPEQIKLSGIEILNGELSIDCIGVVGGINDDMIQVYVLDGGDDFDVYTIVE